MSDAKMGDIPKYDAQILAVLNLIANITKDERRIIRDMPDHFRRIILHTTKLNELIILLKKSIKEERWHEKDELFSKVSQLLAELDPKTGIVTKEVYESYGASTYKPLLEQEKRAITAEEKITLELYDRLDVVAHNRPTKSAGPTKITQKIQQIQARLNQAHSREKISLSIDVHLENIITQLRDMLILQQEIINHEIRLLSQLRLYDNPKITVHELLPELKSITDKLFHEIINLKKLELRIKKEFYIPFQKFHDEKVTSLSLVNNLLDYRRKRWYHRLGLFIPKITLKEVMLEYHTMTSPEEVQEFFIQLQKIPQFLDIRVIKFIQDTTPKLIEKSRSIQRGYQQALYQKTFDPLTGARTKEAYAIEYRRLVSNYQRTKTHFSLLALDIDFFKSFNDTYGHVVGDKVLQNVAKSILKHTRSSTDIFIRFGGEEFLVLLTSQDKNEALKVAEKIRNILPIENPDPINPKTTTAVTVSIGVATYPNDCNEHCSPEEFLNKADEALYSAKRNGRNRVVSA